jgi:hypothetical protein
MSRGPGRLQRRILAEVAAEHEDGLPSSVLRHRLPDADPANVRRAIRGLVRMGRIRTEYDHYHQERRLVPVRARHLSNEELREILSAVASSPR